MERNRREKLAGGGKRNVKMRSIPSVRLGSYTPFQKRLATVDIDLYTAISGVIYRSSISSRNAEEEPAESIILFQSNPALTTCPHLVQFGVCTDSPFSI